VAFSPAPMMHNAPIIYYWGSVLWSGGCVVCSADMAPGAFARTIAACRPNWMAIPLPLLVKMHNDGVLEREHFKGARLSTAGNTARIAELTGAEASRLPAAIIDFFTGIDAPRIYVLLLLIALLLVLGCVLDSIAIVLILTPFLYPIVIDLGYDLIWFGILMVMVVEIGLMTPPFGINVFAINALAPKIKLGQDIHRRSAFCRG